VQFVNARNRWKVLHKLFPGDPVVQSQTYDERKKQAVFWATKWLDLHHPGCNFYSFHRQHDLADALLMLLCEVFL
jgi:hypothetical protein